MTQSKHIAVDKLRLRKRHYHDAFAAAFKRPPGMPVHPAVLDLAKFCRAFAGDVALRRDGSVDMEMTMVLKGRREAFMRIFEHLNLEPDELTVLYRAVVIPAQEENDG